jgi:protein gp37
MVKRYSNGKETGGVHTASKGNPYPFGFDPTYFPHRLEEPYKVKEPCRIFWNDMGDMFGAWWPSEIIEANLKVMRETPWHTHLLLTKNPKRYQEFEIPDNAAIGTTVEDDSKRWRIDDLLKAKASLYWISHEPAMGELDIAPYLPCQNCGGTGLEPEENGSPYWHPDYPCRKCDGPPYVGWLVTGAMSGSQAVPMDEDWVRQERDDCVESGVPFFFKQRIVNGKKVEMPELDGKVWAEYPKGVCD